MGAREVLRNRPKTAMVVASVVIVMAGLASLYESLGARAHGPVIVKMAYYTVDDGATYFPDDVMQVPPYTHDGKQAVRAFVERTNTGKLFVAYLVRYSDRAKQNIERLKAKPGVDPAALEVAMDSGKEVKAPLTGDHGWVSVGTPASESVCDLHAPPGMGYAMEPAYP